MNSVKVIKSVCLNPFSRKSFPVTCAWRGSLGTLWRWNTSVLLRATAWMRDLGQNLDQLLGLQLKREQIFKWNPQFSRCGSNEQILVLTDLELGSSFRASQWMGMVSLTCSVPKSFLSLLQLQDSSSAALPKPLLLHIYTDEHTPVDLMSLINCYSRVCKQS